MPFYAVSSADLISKFVGESEKYVKTLFEMVKKDKPCVLFLDEVESLCAKREESSQTNTVQQFLIQLDGITNGGSMDGVLLIGCSNLPWRLDEAMIRRLEKRIYVPLPTIEEREAQLRFYINRNDNSLTAKDFTKLAQLTEYFSASDIKVLVKCACMLPLRFMREAQYFELLKDGTLKPCDAQNKLGLPMTFDQIADRKTIVLPPVSYQMVLDALECTKSTIDTTKLTEYEEWTRKYGQ
jgi:vacuolar protein-sorting-associated protein 4